MVEQPLLSDASILLSDRHCHCEYSIDAVGSISEYCETAIKRGLKKLTLTTHYDCIPDSTANVNFMSYRGTRVPTSLDILQHYVDEVRRAGDAFASRGLVVECGIEFGWYRGCEEIVKSLREKFKLDWVLAGLHEVDGISFASRRDHTACFSRYSADAFLEKYFKDVAEAATSDLFDAIAHLDYYRKYGVSYYGEELLSASTTSREQSLHVLASSGTGAEINTSGIRRGAGDWFPANELVTEMISAGVKIVSLGSDAHRPEDVGDSFNTIADWIGDYTKSDSRISHEELVEP